MSKKDIENANFDDTGYSYTLSLIAGKYKPVILYCLMEYAPVRFNEMQRYLKKVSDKTLSQNLKELEADNLIIRKVYPQIPPISKSEGCPCICLIFTSLVLSVQSPLSRKYTPAPFPAYIKDSTLFQ